MDRSLHTAANYVFGREWPRTFFIIACILIGCWIGGQ